MLALGRWFFRSSNTHRVFSYIIVCGVSCLLDFWEADEIVVSEAMIFRSLNTLRLYVYFTLGWEMIDFRCWFFESLNNVAFLFILWEFTENFLRREDGESGAWIFLFFCRFNAQNFRLCNSVLLSFALIRLDIWRFVRGCYTIFIFLKNS